MTRGLLERWRARAQSLKRSTYALYLAAKHPRTPWYAKAMALLVVGYAFSPIDLIPDPIPVVGYLDDLVLLPLGVWITLKLIPAEVWVECREHAERNPPGKRPRSWIAAAIVVCLWIGAMYLVIRMLWPWQ